MPFAVILGLFSGWFGRLILLTLVLALGDMITDVLLSLISSGLNLVANAVQAAGISLPPLPDWDGMPLTFMKVMKRCGFDTALAIIVTAIAIKWVGKMFGFATSLRKGVPA